MLPVIIFAVTAVTVVGSEVKSYLKSECPCCGENYYNATTCDFSNTTACSSCCIKVEPVEFDGSVIISGGHCRKDKIAERDAYIVEAIAPLRARAELMERVERIKPHAGSVKFYAKSYKGAVPRPKHGKQIDSGWHYGKDTAELVLRALTLFEGCSLIQGVEFSRKPDREFGYVQTLWCAKGII